MTRNKASGTLLRWAIAAAALSVHAQSLAAQTHNSSDAIVARIRADIRYLADDAREGRGVGTAGLDSAASYLARRFAEIGLEPAGTDGYFQPFTLDPSAPALAHSSIGAVNVKNVVGRLPGRGALADQVVIIGAHYDHLGLGGSGSLDPDSTGVVHNGADDNASGTAALLAAATLLSETAPPARRTLYFVAFTAEELGLLGSEHFARDPTYAKDAAFAMLNFDMVGRLREKDLLVIGTGSAEEFPDLIESVNREYGLTLAMTADPWGRSDHSSFYAQHMPVLHLFTNTHSEYHRTTDDSDLINADGIAFVTRFAVDVVSELATRGEPLTFVNVEAPPPATGGGYGAWLGTIPDMTESPGGVRLTGVRAGSPAAEAGMREGDILIKLGTYEITNLYDMSAALRAYKPGDTVDIVVLRDGERIESRTTLKRRGG